MSNLKYNIVKLENYFSFYEKNDIIINKIAVYKMYQSI